MPSKGSKLQNAFVAKVLKMLQTACAVLSLASWPAAAAMPEAAPSLSWCAAHAPSAPNDPVRSGALSRGVNMTDALRPKVAMAQVQRDMAAVRNLGLRHVRLPISPSWVLGWSEAGLPGAQLQRLDAVVCAAVVQGLAVVLDAHPEDDLALKDTSSPANVDELGAAWDRIATRYAVIPPGLMVFEALNEPGLTDAGRWAHDRHILLNRIRRVAPCHTVLLTASPSSTAAALAGSEPERDRRLAYVFHFYRPMVFTHQGAEWGNLDLSSIHGLTYPATQANVDRVKVKAIPSLQPTLDRYASKDGVADAIRGEIALAARWAAQFGVPLVTTELGVFGTAERGSREAWLRDVRSALEASRIGWTVWEYRGGFGIETDLAAPCGDTGSMRIALGLCPTHSPRSRR